MSRKRVFFVFTGLVILLTAFTFQNGRLFEIARNLEIFSTLYKEVNSFYVDAVNPNHLMKSGIDSMLQSLDPYTKYISEDVIENYRTRSTGQYGGIGAGARRFGQRTVVTMVYNDSPAEKYGLEIGDEIVQIDSIQVADVTMDESENLTHGQVGSNILIKVRRHGSASPISLELVREKIKIKNVPYLGLITPETGYIKLSEFTPDAANEVKKAVNNLKKQGAKGLILDLRDNPGGLLLEAVRICNLFIPKDKLVVSTKGKWIESNTEYLTEENPIDLDIPIAVLINRRSASASEIVAGTLQDYDRAVVVGENSFGKGLVQAPRPLPYHSQVRITTAKYYIPSGRCIQILDYSHRRPDGSVGSVPDSVKQAFTTTSGRPVFDGGGIEPDIAIAWTTQSPLSHALTEQGCFFDYATQFASQTPSIAAPDTFRLSDAAYDQFKAWVIKRKPKYESPVLEQVNQLEAVARQEGRWDDYADTFQALKAKLEAISVDGLTSQKDLLKMLLEEDICSRYYLEEGRVKCRFKYDLCLKEGIDIVHTARLDSILNK